METPNREYATVGLALIVLAWVLVEVVEILGNPSGFVMPVIRVAGVLFLTAAVVKGSRAASIGLLVWSIVGILLGGFMGALLVLATGVILFLSVGGHKAFVRRIPSEEIQGPSP